LISASDLTSTGKFQKFITVPITGPVNVPCKGDGCRGFGREKVGKVTSCQLISASVLTSTGKFQFIIVPITGPVNVPCKGDGCRGFGRAKAGQVTSCQLTSEAKLNKKIPVTVESNLKKYAMDKFYLTEVLVFAGFVSPYKRNFNKSKERLQSSVCQISMHLEISFRPTLASRIDPSLQRLGCRLDDRGIGFLGGVRDFSLHCVVQTDSGIHPTSHLVSRAARHEADHSPIS
jgi:hypothetical protein